MRVVLTHAPGSNIRQLRQVLLGAGLECTAADCIAWDEFAIHLAQSDADLLVVKVEEDRSPDWNALREASALVSAPMLAVGPIGNERVAAQARRAGAVAYVDQAALRGELDVLLDHMTAVGGTAQQRGKLICVLAPAPGSGGSTVAVNLAGALAHDYPREVGLVELERDAGDVALLLNATPQCTVQDVCQRWQSLDTMSLRNSFLDHPSGLNLLVNAIDPSVNEFLSLEAVRRICVLARVTFRITIFALDGRVADEQLEVMRLSDFIVLVVRADVPALRRANWSISTALAQGISHDRFRLVVNRWGQAGQLKMKQIETSLGLAVQQFLPDDPARVNRAANQGVLLRELSRRSKLSRRFAKLATSLNGESKNKKNRWWR